MTINNSDKKSLRKRALFLSYFTVGYNVLEGLISILAGALAGSVALLGFGLDSFVESLSGAIMIWRFGRHQEIEEHEEEKIEKIATRAIAITFFILAAYVIYESTTKLINNEVPEPSLLGIIVAIFSIVIMPLLFLAKYRTGKSLKSKSLVADSKETLACFFLSVSLLIGLGLNYWLGLWQADPIVGLLIAGFLIYEGYETFKGED